MDHVDDIESDLSVFHRVDDMYAMPAPQLLRFALRLPAYAGVLRARIEAEAAAEHAGGRDSSTPSRGAGGNGRMQYDEPAPVTPLTVAQDPVLSSLISFGTG